MAADPATSAGASTTRRRIAGDNAPTDNRLTAGIEEDPPSIAVVEADVIVEFRFGDGDGTVVGVDSRAHFSGVCLEKAVSDSNRRILCIETTARVGF